MKIAPLILCLGVKKDQDRKRNNGLEFLDEKNGNCEPELLSGAALHPNGPGLVQQPERGRALPFERAKQPSICITIRLRMGYHALNRGIEERPI
jgi:hypothetical protein